MRALAKNHPGEKISDWLDGRCDADEHARIEHHLGRCRPCRDAADTERLIKARLAALRGPDPDPTFLLSLATIGGPSGPLPPRPRDLPGAPRVGTVLSPRAEARRRRGAAAAAVPGTRPQGRVDRTTGPWGPADASSRPGSRGRRMARRVASFGVASILGAGVVTASFGGFGQVSGAVRAVLEAAPAVVAELMPDLGGAPTGDGPTATGPTASPNP